jgi:hypothetical protein
MQSAKLRAASVTEMAFSLIESDYQILRKFGDLARLMVSITQPELHGKVVFVVFEAGHVAVFLNDAAMQALEGQMGGGDGGGSKGKVLKTLLDPWFGGNRKPDNDGEEM